MVTLFKAGQRVQYFICREHTVLRLLQASREGRVRKESWLAHCLSLVLPASQSCRRALKTVTPSIPFP